MGWIGCVRCEKIPTWLRATNFCFNCTTSPRFAQSFMQLRKDPKCTRTLWNAPKHEFRVQWGFIRCVGCEKLQRDFVARTFALIAPVLSIWQQVSCSCETITNAPKYYETHQNISLGCNGADWVHSLGKNPVVTSRHELLHAPLHPVLYRVSCSYEKIPNAPEHYEMHQNMI